MIGAGIIVAVVLLLYFSLARSAGLADRRMEEIYRLSAAREAGGVDGNSCKGAERSKTGWNDCGIGKIGKRFKKLYALQVLLWK